MGRPTKEESARRAAARLATEQASIPGIEVPSDTTPTPAPSPVQPYTPTGINSGDGKVKQRFTMTLGEDGKPDFSSMRDATKEQFRAFILDPNVKTQLGMDGADKPPAFTEDTIKFFYSALGPVEAYAFALVLKCPIDLASKVFKYTPEEIDALTPPTLALANKYAHLLTAYTRWQEEINFGLVFITVTQSKLAALRQEVAQLTRKLSNEENPALKNNIREQVESVPSMIPIPPVDGFAVAAGSAGA